ncbi:MAG: Ig-like domain repeat protein [Myxococcales bacterium]|nr:Ig-like domain repeat protein [Myxococcales bacterium]
MNRMASMRVGAVLASLTMAMAGCTCGPVDCAKTPSDPSCVCDNTDLTVAFVAPMEGAMVDQTSNVQVSLSRKGSPVNIGTAKLEVRGPGATDFSDKGNGTADGATATFTGVMLTAGENALRATVAEANCNGSANPKTIVVTAKSNVTPPPVIVSCTFPQDANGDGTLNAAELPTGTAVSVRVLTTNGAGATFSAPGSNPAMAPIMNDTATIGVPGPAADGTFSVTGTVTRGTGAPTCSPMIRVARARPSCMNSTKRLNGPSDDASMMAGFQLSTSGVVAASVRNVTFSTTGVQPVAATPVNGDVSAVLALPAMGDVTYPIRLEGTDADGNTCEDIAMVRVDLVGPSLTITSPVAAADGGPAVVTMTPANLVVATDSDPGSMVCVQRRQGTATPVAVGCSVVANGAAIVAVTFASSGAYDLIATVTDTAGNTTTRTVSVVANLTNCGVAFTRPGMCPGFITSSQLMSGNYSFEISSPTCAGQTARLLINGTRVGADRVIGSNGILRVDAPLMNGMFTARAEVANLVGADSATECAITVDTNAPAWVNPQPQANMQPTLIGANQDQQPATPGVQRVLSFNAVVPTGGRATICTTQQNDPVTTQARMACPDGDMGWYLLTDNVTSPASAFTFPNGTYSLRVVVTTNSVSNVSADLPVIVDAVRPCVLANSVAFPQDANSDGILNIAELGTNAPRLSFRLDPACGVSDLSGLQSTVVRRIVGGAVDNAVAFNLPADVGVNAGVVTVSLSQNITDSSTQFFVQLTRTVSLNQNLYGGMADPATRSVRIDRGAPTCTISSPSGAGPFGSGAVPGGMLAATVQTSNDVPSVRIDLGGPTAATANAMVQMATNSATASFPVTGDNQWTLDATCIDTAGNTTPATRVTFRVDLVAPTCTITSPAAGSSFTMSPPNTSVSVTGADGQSVVLTSSLTGAAPLGSPLAVVGGVAQSAAVPYENSPTAQTITAAVADTAGNGTTCSSANVTINTTNCNLVLTNVYSASSPAAPPPGNWVNLSNSTVSGPNRTFIFAGVSTNCVGREARLSRTVPVTMPHLQSVTVPTGGSFAFAAANVVDGEQYAIGVDNGSGVVTAISVAVDLSAPSLTDVTMNTRSVTTAPSLFFVANSLNRNVERGVAGYVPDSNADTTAADVDFSLTAVGSQSAMFPGRVTLAFTGAMDVTTPLSGTTASFTGRQFTQGTPGTLTLTVLEPTGNATVYSKATVVDVQGPGAPGNVSVALAADPTDGGAPARRTGSVAVGWDPSANLAGDPSGGYDLRWTTSSVAGACTVPSPCAAITAVGEFFADTTFPATADIQSSLIGYGAGRTVTTLTLPPLNTYFVNVRAVDGVGNYSPFQPTVSLDNTWAAERRVLSPSTGINFGIAMAVGNVLGDSRTDLIVGASARATNVGSVFVFTGGSIDGGACGTGCQELQPPTPEPGLFGTDVSAGGNLGNVGAEVLPDLVVAQPTWPTNVTSTAQGRVFVYFGTSGATLDTVNYIEIRGTVGEAFGSTAQIIKDIDGDGLDELAVSAHSQGSGQGRVYIFRGRAANPAGMPANGNDNWYTTRSSGFVSSGAATWILAGPTPVAPGGNEFGRLRWGVAQLGDVDGDGRQDFAIPMSKLAVNRLVAFSGARVAATNAALPNPASSSLTIDIVMPRTIATDGYQVLLAPTGTSTGNAVDGFARRTIGNLTIGGARSLVVTNPNTNALYLYTGVSGSVPSMPSTTITGAPTFGYNSSAGDLNGDGLADLVVSENSVANANNWLVYQQQNASRFDSVAQVAPVTGPAKFWISRVIGPASGRLGRVNLVQDFDGDGQPELVLADEGNSQVVLWR